MARLNLKCSSLTKFVTEQRSLVVSFSITYPKPFLMSDSVMHSIWILDLPVLTALRVNFPSASSEVIFFGLQKRQN